MAVAPLVDGEQRSIDARSIVTLIVFFAVNVPVIWPIRIPLPIWVGRAWERMGGRRRERMYFPLDLRTVPVLGVLVLLASTCIPGGVVRRGIVGSAGVKPYDIMVLFAYISLSLDATGSLRFLAFWVASRSSHGGRLYAAFYGLYATIGAVFGNDPLILSGTPFLAYFTDHAGIVDPTAFLFTHFQVSNLVSALLVSSNPTNLVLTSAFGINFLQYSAWLVLPTLASVVVLFPLARWVFFRGKNLIPTELHPPPVTPRDALVDPVGAVFGAVLFAATVAVLIGLSAGGVIGGTVGVWTVTAPAAVVLFLRDVSRDWTENRVDRERSKEAGAVDSDVEAEGKRLPWLKIRERFPIVSANLSHLPIALVPFAISFFILVEGLQHTGWIAVFGRWWGAWERVGGVAGSVWLMGVLSVVGCNIFGTNIGATILLARVLQSWATTHTYTNRSLYAPVYALAVGSNFGAYSFVFSASLAGLLWRSILGRKGIKITMKQFMRWNIGPLIVTMIVGCLVVAGEVCIMYKD
ncbi:uncharacterized protein L203_104186 [Cryptococcus depauperatus CBS 7841]|uniref:Citrate transporter-like domain-containing protein n=1 Tax=Cryptococcus depauperatus CBS 7841 TaxID=1295531 RepID=A0AAJ8JUZ3_9TREE